MDSLTTEKVLLYNILLELKKQTPIIKEISEDLKEMKEKQVIANNVNNNIKESLVLLEQSLVPPLTSFEVALESLSENMQSLVNITSSSNIEAVTQRQCMIHGNETKHSREFFQASSSLVTPALNAYTVLASVALSRPMALDQSIIFGIASFLSLSSVLINMKMIKQFQQSETDP
ncbi:hypothetical protein R6Q59_010977, partial [Mikania micrantha]